MSKISKLSLLITFLGILSIIIILTTNTYENKYNGKIYFAKKYEKTDDEYVYTAMLGDIISFQKDSVFIVNVEDVKKIREELEQKGIHKDFIDPRFNGKYSALAYHYDNAKYNFFKKKISADEMEDIQILDDKTIMYNNQVYVYETNLENVFFNGKMPNTIVGMKMLENKSDMKIKNN